MDQFIGSALHCLWLFELAHLLNVIHEVTTVNILHDKVEAVLDGDTKREKFIVDLMTHSLIHSFIDSLG